MGRRYVDEISEFSATYDFARSTDVRGLAGAVDSLRTRPLIVVGSGGSTSGAQFAARLHEQHARLPARVMTPLEFLRHPVPQTAGVLLLSASGRNRDILAAANHAVIAEYAAVAGLCTRADTPLRATLAPHRHTSMHEVIGSSAKDGFLATNSLLLTATVLARAYGVTVPDALPAINLAASQDGLLSKFVREAASRTSVVALASDWAIPAAADLESKWSEIGFGSVTVTDPRNFAHGRHHGLSRRVAQTLVLGISAGPPSGVLQRTLDVLPKRACVELLSTPLSGEAGTLDLLVRVMMLTGEVGKSVGIDVGRPRVPAFGRTLYHGSPIASGRARTVALGSEDTCDLWIRRKVSHAVWESAENKTRAAWRTECAKWISAAESASIGAVVFDYDGTMCEEEERFSAPAARIGVALTRLLNAGISVGVATGRGDSVLTALREIVPQPLWSKLTIGMYNGGCICRLDETPTLEASTRPEIEQAQKAIENSALLSTFVNTRARPAQLTLRCTCPLPEGLFYRLVLEALGELRDRFSLQVVASGHTVDVVAAGVSKLRVVDAVRAELPSSDLRIEHAKRNHDFEALAVMTIGDQGQLGGNDAAFLAQPLGLSVENVSSVFGECWNVAPPGLRRTAALLNYLEALEVTKGVGRWSVAKAALRAKRVGRPNLGATPRINIA